MDKIGDVLIRKRGKKYEYKFEIEPLDGKRKWKSRGGFSLKREAIQAGKQAREEYIKTNGKPARKQDNISFNTLSELYLERILSSKEPTTYATYEISFRKHFCPVLGRMAVRDIDYKDIEDLFRQISNLELSESRVKSLEIILKDAFNFAIKPLHIITENPVKLAEPILNGIPEKERIPYTREQIHQLLDAIPVDSPYRIIIILGIFCGMRLGEILGLTWDCIDFENETITIEKQMANMKFEQKAFQIIKKPKSQKSIRTLHFSETVKKELCELKNLQSQDMQLLGEDYVYVETETVDLKGKKVERVVRKHMIEDESKELCLVCRKRDGGHIQSRTVDVFMRSLSKKVGFHCTSHISRHTHATLLLEEGANIANISARLGHNGSDITMQYLHSTKEADYDISNRVEKAILSTE